jgi:hypothetical protein
MNANCPHNENRPFGKLRAGSSTGSGQAVVWDTRLRSIVQLV